MMAGLISIKLAAHDFLRRWKTAERRSASQGRVTEAAIALGICVLILVVALSGDENLVRSARDLPAEIRAIFAIITRAGESGWIFATTGALVIGALLLRHRGLGPRVDAALGLFAGRVFYILAANAVAGILSLLLKSLFGRARPRLLDVVGPFHFDMFAYKSSVLSFPSGHTVTAFATAVALAFLLPRWGRLFLLLAVLIGVSRVVTGAHFPSDVIAGMALGTATSIFLRRAFAARGIVFRKRATGIEMRGAGLVGPTLGRATGFWSRA